MYAAIFRFGAYQVTESEDSVAHESFEDVFRVFMALIFGAISIGQAGAFAPNYTKARISSHRIFHLIDRVPEIDGYSTAGETPVSYVVHVSYVVYGCDVCSFLYATMHVIFHVCILTTADTIDSGIACFTKFGHPAFSHKLTRSDNGSSYFTNHVIGHPISQWTIVYGCPISQWALSYLSQESKSISGDVKAEDVAFHYPSRPDVTVLDGLDVSIQQGKTLALVGPSGCGKSTIVSLLERFYDPRSGQLTLDGRDLRDLNIRWLRSQIGIVSQEPVLFDTTIAENIRYGASFREVSDEEVVEAAKAANIHNFVESLPAVS